MKQPVSHKHSRRLRNYTNWAACWKLEERKKSRYTLWPGSRSEKLPLACIWMHLLVPVPCLDRDLVTGTCGSLQCESVQRRAKTQKYFRARAHVRFLPLRHSVNWQVWTVALFCSPAVGLPAHIKRCYVTPLQFGSVSELVANFAASWQSHVSTPRAASNTVRSQLGRMTTALSRAVTLRQNAQSWT